MDQPYGGSFSRESLFSQMTLGSSSCHKTNQHVLGELSMVTITPITRLTSVYNSGSKDSSTYFLDMVAHRNSCHTQRNRKKTN